MSEKLGISKKIETKVRPPTFLKTIIISTLLAFLSLFSPLKCENVAKKFQEFFGRQNNQRRHKAKEKKNKKSLHDCVEVYMNT